MMDLMLITNDPELAIHAEQCGVSRIFVDLERNGKTKRQGHLDTLISRHSINDIRCVKNRLSIAKLLVRVNPLHKETKNEIEMAIDFGADFLMLPMFRSAEELKEFSSIVDSRAKIIPLVETCDAVNDIDNILEIPGIHEIYLGLNDLHLDMKMKFIFEPLANGLVENLARKITNSKLRFGFGGMARIGEGLIPGELILAEHLRLNSNSVILSRTFHRKSEGFKNFQENLDLKKEIDKIMQAAVVLSQRAPHEVIKDKNKVIDLVAKVVESIP